MFLYKITITGEYYRLSDTSIGDKIICAHIVSAKGPEDARKLAHEEGIKGEERSVSLGNHGLLGYGELSDIWLHEKYAKVTKLGTSDVKRGVVISVPI